MPAPAPVTVPRGLDLSAIVPVPEEEESPLMTAAPPSHSGSGGGRDRPGKIQLTKEQAEFATRYCGISTDEYERQLRRHRHLKTIDPGKYD